MSLRVRNWEKFQHYHKRNPPWIRLYNEILDNYDLSRLPDASKWHVVGIWLLASRFDNKIPDDPKWIAQRIQATTTVAIDVLISAGFIERYDDSASTMLAERKQSAIPEGEGETEKREIKKVVRKSWRFCPEDWKPSEHHQLMARQLGVDLASAEARFRDHEYAKPKTDPDRAFSTWLRNTAEWATNGNGNGKHPKAPLFDLTGYES